MNENPGSWHSPQDFFYCFIFYLNIYVVSFYFFFFSGMQFWIDYSVDTFFSCLCISFPLWDLQFLCGNITSGINCFSCSENSFFFFSWITVEVSGLWFLHFVHISFCKEPGSLPPNDSKSNNLQCLTNWLKVCHIFHGPALGYWWHINHPHTP